MLQHAVTPKSRRPLKVGSEHNEQIVLLDEFNQSPSPQGRVGTQTLELAITLPIRSPSPQGRVGTSEVSENAQSP